MNRPWFFAGLVLGAITGTLIFHSVAHADYVVRPHMQFYHPAYGQPVYHDPSGDGLGANGDPDPTLFNPSPRNPGPAFKVYALPEHVYEHKRLHLPDPVCLAGCK